MISSPFVKYRVNHKVQSKNRFSILLGVGVIIAISIKERNGEGGRCESFLRAMSIRIQLSSSSIVQGWQ